jgi:FkbM family methyltransferase
MIKTLEAVTYDFQPADLFIDIGGNVGLWTVELFGLYERIFFVEPSQTAIDDAKQRINTHCDYFQVPHLKNKVSYFKNLCSDIAGEKKSIASTTSDTGNFSIYAEELYGSQNVQMAEADIETINVDSLIPLVKENAKVMIKIDTEGCDLDIIIGATEFIKKFKPVLIVEFHWHMYYDQVKRDKVFNLLQSLGYNIQTYIFGCYVDNPETVFDLVHNGEQMKNLHFQAAFTPPANIAPF